MARHWQRNKCVDAKCLIVALGRTELRKIKEKLNIRTKVFVR